MIGMWHIEVYTDYSGKSDQVAYIAVKECRYTGKKYVFDYDTKYVSSKYRRRSAEGEFKGVLWAMERYPGVPIRTDCKYAVREANSGLVTYIPGHAGYHGNMHADYLARNGDLHPGYSRNW